METVTTTLLLGATAGINGGLLAASAIDRMQLASSVTATALVVLVGAAAGAVVVTTFRSMLAMLSEIPPQAQVI